MAKIDTSEFVVGEKWLFVPNDRRNTRRWITIASVGRKLVKFKETKLVVDVARDPVFRYTVWCNTYGGQGIVYRTESAYEEAMQLNKLQSKFRSAVTEFMFCFGLTKQQITEAAKILGIDLEKSE